MLHIDRIDKSPCNRTSLRRPSHQTRTNCGNGDFSPSRTGSAAQHRKATRKIRLHSDEQVVFKSSAVVRDPRSDFLSSTAIAAVTNLLARLATTESSIVLRGDTCVGKRDLESLIEEGPFRAHLACQFSVVQIDVLPRRQRRDDVVPLAEFFLKRLAGPTGTPKKLSEEVRRELEHAIERAVARRNRHHRLEMVLVRHTKNGLRAFTDEIFKANRSLDETVDDVETADDVEESFPEVTLRQTGDNHSETARRLTLPRQTLQHRLKKHGLG